MLGDGWWPQTAKQDGEICKSVFIMYGRNITSAQILEFSIRGNDGAPRRKGCVVNGQTAEASNK
ncbi:unnamed protein product [Sphacelaria rigidula]